MPISPQIKFRADARCRAVIDALCAAKGQSISDLVRSLLFREARRLRLKIPQANPPA